MLFVLQAGRELRLANYFVVHIQNASRALRGAHSQQHAVFTDTLVTYRILPPGKPPMDCRHLAESSKETSSPSSEPEALPPSVGQRAGAAPGRPAAANAARERSRVQTLRQAFLELQKTLPSVPPDTKLSKLDVLLLATTYIAHLTRSLQDEEEAPGEGLGALRGDGYLHPVKVGWLRGSGLSVGRLIGVKILR